MPEHSPFVPALFPLPLRSHTQQKNTGQDINFIKRKKQLKTIYYLLFHMKQTLKIQKHSKNKILNFVSYETTGQNAQLL